MFYHFKSKNHLKQEILINLPIFLKGNLSSCHDMEMASSNLLIKQLWYAISNCLNAMKSTFSIKSQRAYQILSLSLKDIIWVLPHSDINFANMLKIIRNSSKLRDWPYFQTILNIFAKLMCKKNFLKFLLQNKKWKQLQNQQKDILQQKNVVAGMNLPYIYR